METWRDVLLTKRCCSQVAGVCAESALREQSKDWGLRPGSTSYKLCSHRKALTLLTYSFLILSHKSNRVNILYFAHPARLLRKLMIKITWTMAANMCWVLTMSHTVIITSYTLFSTKTFKVDAIIILIP